MPSPRLLLVSIVALAAACRPGAADETAAEPQTRAAEARLPPGAASDPAGTGRAPVNGHLRIVEGQRVLTVWGSPAEMGYAHGFLLRAEILDVVENYALGVLPKATIEAAGAIYARVADISERRRAEAGAIISGMQAAGSLRIEGLDRDLKADDILVLNAMTDLLAIGCSSVSAWGASTRADAKLEGAPIVVRNLDWSDEPALLRNQVVIAYQPRDPEFQPVASVAFAGYFGCLSCLSEAGVTVLFNMGYGDGAASYAEAASGFAPANLALRDAMEARDVDGDGRSSAADIEAWVRSKTQAGSYILHLVEPGNAANAAPARILEVESDGVATRWPATNVSLAQTTLAATNHLRQKSQPQACSRYAKIGAAVRADEGGLDGDDLWAIARSIRLDAVVHTIRVEPETRSLSVWLRRPGDAADASDLPVTHGWESLFEHR